MHRSHAIELVHPTGSTITQQLVRNLYIGKADRTLSRKLKEACLAEKLAGVWSKKQILAAYLNEVFYGRHAYGAQAAAQTFYSTSAMALTRTATTWRWWRPSRLVTMTCWQTLRLEPSSPIRPARWKTPARAIGSA